MNDDRTGYENFIGSTLGVKGKLRRDESNDALVLTNSSKPRGTAS